MPTTTTTESGRIVACRADGRFLIALHAGGRVAAGRCWQLQQRQVLLRCGHVVLVAREPGDPAIARVVARVDEALVSRPRSGPGTPPDAALPWWRRA